MLGGRKCGFLAVCGTVFLIVFAVPVNSAQVIAEKANAQPYLGVMVAPMERGEPGILIREVTPDSPAAKAGIQVGDRVLKINDKDIANVQSFMQTIASSKPNDKLTLHINRGGQEQDISATLAERPAMESQPGGRFPGGGIPGGMKGRRPAFLGVQTVPISADVKSRLQLKDDKGVVITEVIQNSAAAKAGLKNDDVIVLLDNKSITHPDQLRDVIMQTGPNKEITVQLIRGGETQNLKVTLGEFSGNFMPSISNRFPGGDESMFVDPGRRIRELERRIEELERRVQELEKKSGSR